ncbi:DUF6082 family protein [Catenuloplanes niger]|uniref:DUF6082 family protein n=1 Tax=Catenuloplanes niger TaxID=587534 RepID=UPI0035B55146
MGRLGEIGQAYGPISTLLSAIALCVAVLVQRRQLRQERVVMARELHADVLRTAMEEPAYGQCWGPRVTPEHVDERLFYYSSSILTAWFHAWECGDLTDEAVRSYARSMADSEIPRMYWIAYGGWRLSAARGPELRFLRMVDGEFRAAMAGGPPSRRAEPIPGGERLRSPRGRVARRRDSSVRAYSVRFAERRYARNPRH